MFNRISDQDFFGIGIWQPQKEINVGTLFRSAFAFGANYIFTIGRKYHKQSSDTCATPKHIPYFRFDSTEDFLNHIPFDTRLVSIEITDQAKLLNMFEHPQRCVYVLGSEGQTLPNQILEKSIIVKIPTKVCLNVSTAGSVVMYDRVCKYLGN